MVAYVCSDRHTNYEDEANGERIVACVNACAGIEDPEDAIRSAIRALTEIAATHYNDRTGVFAKKALAKLSPKQES